MTSISLSRRLRRTPFSDGVEAAGVKGYTVYNRMLLPTVFRSLEEDYRHLKSAVQVWDVAVERQIEVSGPDAARLMQLLTPRDLGRMQPDQCFYIPVVNEQGGMLNDPVTLRPDEDRWWISIADSDLLFWVNGLAVGMGLEVRVHEPDVSPLAVQGPLADDLMARVFGEDARAIRFFRHKRLAFGNTSFIVARSGYSKQGGFEIYVEGSEHGMPVWNALFEAGRDLDVHAGGPNLIERIEGGLLSYGNDMTSDNTPFQCGLGKFCHLGEDQPCIGAASLRAEKASGPTRQIRAVAVDGAPITFTDRALPVTVDGAIAGQITSVSWSPDHQTNVAIGMIDAAHWADGTSAQVETLDGPRSATIRTDFWA